jgi:predicted site-specific integrase-resolvase
MEQKPKSWLKLDDVIEELGVARSTLDAWRREGKGPVFRALPNGSLRIRRSELESWMDDLATV